MYNSRDMIFDNELTFLSYNQSINHEWTCEELILSNLWFIEQLDTLVYKCIPLFNCDKITTNNASDKVLENNKCLILNFNEDTRIECVSDDTGGIHYHDIVLYAYTPYSKLDVIDEVTVYCILYDNYLNTLNNTSVEVIIDNESFSEIVTGNDGVCRFKIDKPCSIKFKYNNITSNTITIIEE